MAEKNLTLNYWPVGTGPYMLTEYVENRRHVLERNPNFRGEPYPCEGEPGDKEKGYLADCGKTIPVRRQGRVRHREGRRAAAGEIPAGLLRLAGDRAPRLRHRIDRRDGRLEGKGEGVPREGHQAADDDRGEQLVHRLQLARPGRRQGRHAGAGRAQPEAAPGAVDRDRLGGAHRDLRARPGRGRAGSAAAVAVRLSRGRPVGVQSGRLHEGAGRQAGAAPDRGGEEAARRGRLPRRPRREDRQAAGGQLRLPAVADARRQGAARLVREAVREDRRPAGGARDRLQPLPGQDEQGLGPDLLLGLARRLPGRRELPVHAVRPELEGADRRQRREQHELPEPGVRQAVRSR